MVLTIQPQVSGTVARPAAEGLPFKPGQVLEALVLGKTPDGLVALKIGDVVVNAQLPQTLPAGTTLQLQVKMGGASPQLAMVGTPTLPATVAQTASALPLAAMQVTPPVTNGPVAAASEAIPSPAGAPTTQQVAVPSGAPQLTTGVITATAQPAGAVVPTPSQAPATPAAPAPLPQSAPPSSGGPVPPQAIIQAAPVPPSAGPIADSAQAPAALSSSSASLSPNATAPVPTTTRPQVSSNAPATGGTVQPSAQTMQPASSAAIVAPALAASPAVAVGASPTGAAPPASVPGPAATVAQPGIAASASPATSAPLPAARPSVPSLPAQAASAATPVSPASGVQPQATPATSPTPAATPAAVTAEPVAPSPLLVAQGAVRQPATMADMPRPAVPVAAGTPRPVSAPASPAAALAQMVPEALARQNSVAPLLASLAAVLGKPSTLPEPVLRAALQVLGARVQMPVNGPTAEQLQAAVAKSGLYLEAALAKGAAPAGDLKSGLVALKGALAAFLGGNPAPVEAAKQAAPPLRGMPPRAESLDLPPLPDAPREAGRTLHSQADAALSRVKLMQFASLPDADPARPLAPELRMEVPFLIGHELVMAQFQVTRDSTRRQAEGKRGWTMRFAMNFASAGEVGAEVGLFGRSVNVALWAADPDTAADLEAALPELAPALAALGLEPGGVRVRPVPHEPPPAASGQYLDSRT